jgi:small subunit ribosomal protein S16
MLKIKLARFGKKKQPHYRIVINEARDKRDGRYVEAIGHYAPTMTPKVLTIDMVKYEDWRKKGAQPTETVAALVTRFQSGTPFPPKKPQLSKKAKAKAAAAAEAANKPAETPVEAPAETPVETPVEATTEVAAETPETPVETSQE